jgi:competence ComEA-like helix-hairpin-helix protein
MVLLVKLVIILTTLIMVQACSRRVVYERPNVAAALPIAININTATVAELEKLPHIGRKTAEAIVDFREQNGPFRRVEHIMQIRGISETRFAELGPYLKIE